MLDIEPRFIIDQCSLALIYQTLLKIANVCKCLKEFWMTPLET